MSLPLLHIVNSSSANDSLLAEKENTGFVMIVDDRPTARSLLMGLARSIERGLHVESFADPLAALERAIEMTPDLIISDYRMPGMDGIEFIRRLRAIPKLVEIPIVIVTVVEDRQIRYQALVSGATDFLTHPIDPQECRARCRNLLALRRSQKSVLDRAKCLEDQVMQATLDIRIRYSVIRVHHHELDQTEDFAARDSAEKEDQQSKKPKRHYADAFAKDNSAFPLFIVWNVVETIEFDQEEAKKKSVANKSSHPQSASTAASSWQTPTHMQSRRRAADARPLGG